MADSLLGVLQVELDDFWSWHWTFRSARLKKAQPLLGAGLSWVLLRDPQLPPALLPLDWPGAAAFALCRDFYRVTHKRAEMHLTATLSPDGDPLPPANPEFYRRFGGLD